MYLINLNGPDGNAFALMGYARKIAREKGYVKKRDMLINLAAMPIANKGMVNTLRVSEIE